MAKPPRDPRIFCESLPGATHDIKWENNLVFSVGEKMFASFHHPKGAPFGFGTEPATFRELIQLPGIEPARYMAKHFWISLESQDALPADEIEELLEISHRISAAKLSKKKRVELGIE